MASVSKPMLILIAGPYATGTGHDPDLMARNLERLEEAAWPIFQAGHLPVIGEWVALPVLSSRCERADGSARAGVSVMNARMPLCCATCPWHQCRIPASWCPVLQCCHVARTGQLAPGGRRTERGHDDERGTVPNLPAGKGRQR